jgi:hypothetical protein
MLKKILTTCFYVICCALSVLIFILIGTYGLDTLYRVVNGIPFNAELYQGDFPLAFAMMLACIPEIAIGIGFGIWLVRKILHTQRKTDKA